MGLLENLHSLLRQAGAAEEPHYFSPDVMDYAREIRAIRIMGEEPELTAIGRVFLSLAGQDAVRWLLQVELAQSLGPGDPYRICPETAKFLLATPKHTFERVDKLPYQVSEQTLNRLSDFYLITLAIPIERPKGKRVPKTYILSAAGRSILQDALSEEETPFKVLADALLHDESSRALSRTRTLATLESAFASSAARSMARQARMVAHELQNALLPVQMAVDGLFESIDKGDAHDAVLKYRERIDAGLGRAFGFVNETLRPTALLVEPPEPFDVMASLKDAIAESQAEADAEYHLGPGASLPPLLGYRPRFVLAIKNLLRNAAQASQQPRIDVSVQLRGDRIVICVDDNGPGVPSEYRKAVFAPGFSLRPGGSGQGLALLKEVVEDELAGVVHCEESPLGGARFVVSLPFTARGNR
jgi:signal transduction histidine kinase